MDQPQITDVDFDVADYYALPTLKEPETSYSWREQAECRNHDLDFFGDFKVRAKRICASCTVVEPCLNFAVSNDIQFGVYGGLTPAERNRL